MTYRSGVWKEVQAVLNSGFGPTAPSLDDLLAAGNIQAQSFATNDFIYGYIQLPHDYKEGSDIVVHLHWAPSNTSTGNAVWVLERTVANVGSVLPASTVTSVSQAGAGTAWTHQEVVLATISGTSRKIRDVIAFRLLRNSTGNSFTGTCSLLGVDAYYQADSFGSNSQTTKN